MTSMVKVSLRTLTRRKTQTGVTVVTVALIVGAGSAVTAVASALWLKPLPFPDDARLVSVQTQAPGTSGPGNRGPLHGLSFARLRTGLAGLAAMEGLWARPRAITSDGAEADNIIAVQASAGALALLSTGPAMGRTWTEDEDRANAKLAVLSHGLWQSRFAGDRAILGRTIHVDRQAYEVIGVMPPGFNDLYLRGQLWTPLGIHTGLEQVLPSPGGTYIVTAARLKPGVPARQVDAEARRLMAELALEQPNTLRGWDARVTPLREVRFGGQTPAVVILLLSLLCLAAIGCANLANLSIADLAARRQEIAVRTALGARRRDLMQLQLWECAWLSVTGAVVGLLLAAWWLPVLLSLDATTTTNLGNVGLDPIVLASAVALASAIVGFSRVVPVMRRYNSKTAGLLIGSRGIGTPAGRRIQRGLLALQTGVAVLLVICGGFLLKHYLAVSRVDPGFNSRGLLGAQMRLGPPAYATPQSRADFVRHALDELQRVPGVTGAATTLNLFTPGINFITLIHIDARPTPDGQPRTVQFRRISPSYFRTAGIPLLQGRLPNDSDVFERPRIAVVSQRFAQEFWPGESALNRTIRRSGNTVTIVGVVGDVRDISLAQESVATLYLPFTQDSPPNAPTSFVLRTAETGVQFDAVRAAMRNVDPAQPLSQLVVIDDWLRDTIGAERLRTALLAFLAGIGLLVAIVGVYGLTARSVGDRQREVGLRLALGASRGAIWRLLILDSFTAVGVGLVVGCALVVPAARALQRYLPGLVADAAVPMLAFVILAVCGLLAAAAPARRALRVEPTEALRGE